MIKAVIFDVDGVIVDSKESNIVFFQKLIVKAGFPKPSREEILKNFHLPLWESIKSLIDSTDEVEIKRIWEMGHDNSLRATHLLKFPDDLEPTLEELAKRYKLAIVTSKIRVGVDHLFSVRPIGHLFEHTITFEDYENPKPHPEPLLLALSKLNLKPDEAVYIGDSHTDIEAAKAAGMKSIHYSSKKHDDADLNVTSFGEIVNAVDMLDK